MLKVCRKGEAVHLGLLEAGFRTRDMPIALVSQQLSWSWRRISGAYLARLAAAQTTLQNANERVGPPFDSGVRRRRKTGGTEPTKVDTKQLGDLPLTELQSADLHLFLSIFKHVAHVLSSSMPAQLM